MPLPILRAFTASTLACTRCGSTDVHPLAGAFGPVIGLLGVMRHGCRGCRRAFWIRADAGTRRPTPASEAPPTAKPPGETPRPADAALDFEVSPTTHEKVDLTPLDAEFERIRTGGGATERPSLKEPESAGPEEAKSPGPRKPEPAPREEARSPRSRKRRRRKKSGDRPPHS